MAKLLEGGLAKTVGKAMSGVFLDATLTRDMIPSSPAYDPWNPPAPVPVAYPCKAIEEAYSEKFRLEGLVEQGDRKVLILAATLSVTPQAGDKVTVRGQTFSVLDVTSDPAQATWVCRART